MHSGRIRLGVIGTSWYAQTHITRLAKSPSAELVAIAGRDVTKAHGVPDECAKQSFHCRRTEWCYKALAPESSSSTTSPARP